MKHNDGKEQDRGGVRQSVRQTGRQPWPLHMLAGRGHLIMFQQQLVASEQQMPRHPTAINPPTGRQPAAPEPLPLLQ